MNWIKVVIAGKAYLILPCPCCGGESDLYRIELEPDVSSMGFPNWGVKCSKCGLSLPTDLAFDQGRLEAIARWNKRVCIPDAWKPVLARERLRG